MAQALAAAGHTDQARQVAATITNPYQQGLALTALAEYLPASVIGQLLAGAWLRFGSILTAWPVLCQVDPAVAIRLAQLISNGTAAVDGHERPAGQRSW